MGISPTVFAVCRLLLSPFLDETRRCQSVDKEANACDSGVLIIISSVLEAREIGSLILEGIRSL
jgi:hypothetical protein